LAEIYSDTITKNEQKVYPDPSLTGGVYQVSPVREPKSKASKGVRRKSKK